MTSIGKLNLDRKTAAQAAVVLLGAWALKAFYSAASANELRWILWPTKVVVEWITGTRFYFESFAGYMSGDRSFVIAAACSGVNFLIAVFIMLSLRMLWDHRREGITWLSIVRTAVLSYIVTIGANVLRISSALWLNSAPHRLVGMDREELHRLDGIMVYFGVMLLIYVSYEWVKSGDSFRSWRSYALPLAVYYSITLLVPMVNGALMDAQFLKHAVFVLVAPVVLVGMLLLAGPVVLVGMLLLAVEVLVRDRHREGGAAAAAFFPGDLSADQAGSGADV